MISQGGAGYSAGSMGGNYAGGGGYGGGVGAGGVGAGGVGGGDDCTACGVNTCGAACGGAGGGGLAYVGNGQGSYIQETTYKYVGYGGDFDVIRPRRNIACFICIPLLLLLLPLLWWLFMGNSSTLPDCDTGFANWEALWSQERQEFCCRTTGRGCTTQTTTPATVEQPTPLPTPPPTPIVTPGPPIVTPPPGKVDPYNCAVGAMTTWGAGKKHWCCQVHHVGCPIVVIQTLPPVVIQTPPPAPADPYNCADGFANWQAGWSIAKKAWCCKVHGKGCPQVIGCATTSEPYDCNAGFANWQAGWSVAKKAWCCSHGGKGCPPAAVGCA